MPRWLLVLSRPIHKVPFGLASKTAVSKALVLILVVAGVTGLGAGSALASHVRCGDTITSDTTLDSNLVNCPNNGIVIGADNVTLDLNGHTIDGDGQLTEDCGDDEICDDGVVNDGHSGVTIQGGSVREFALGVLVLEARHTRLLDLSVTRNMFPGLVVANSPRAQVERNVVAANGLNTDEAGVVLFASPHSRIVRNRISDNGDIGLFAPVAEDTVFERNLLSGNPEAGMLIDQSNRNLFRHNRLSRNGEGITVAGNRNVITRNSVSDSRAGLPGDGGGLGIFVAAGRDNLVEHNIVVRTNRAGIQVSLLPEELEGGPPAVNTVVRRNHLRGNRDGVFVQTTARGTRIEGNHAVGAEDDGIDVDSAATTLIGNHAVHNGDLGIEAVPGVTDGGGNHAAANGNPVQCTNVDCK
jgi:parallel beta-helix repeat protein